MRSEWLGGPGVPSAAGDSSPPTLPTVTRGDVFTLPEDEYGGFDYYETTIDNANVHVRPESTTLSPDLQAETERTFEQAPVLNPEEEAPGPGQGTLRPESTDQGISRSPAEELCSGKPFDAFTDLKNGSLFAFRGDSGANIGGGWPKELAVSHTAFSALGKYFYELDEKAVRPGYPKLIQDVWGIEGPIDAAFTRINCQGKTYLFKVSGPGTVGQGQGYPTRV